MVAVSESDASATQAGADANVNQDVNTPEAYKASVFNDYRAWNANNKRMYDEYQDLALSAARRSQDRFDAAMNNMQVQLNEIHKLALTDLANATSWANGENQRTVRHGDVAADRMWNIDEVAALFKEMITEDQPARDALAAAIVDSIAKQTGSNAVAGS